MIRFYLALITILSFVPISLSGTPTGHFPTTSIGYGPPTGTHLAAYTINPNGRQSSLSLNAAQSSIPADGQADIYVNYEFDTTNKNVFIVYTTNGSEPNKTNNAGSVSATFSRYSEPDRWWVGRIPSIPQSTIVKYVIYISNSDLASAWGRIDNNGYATSWEENTNIGFSYLVQAALPVSFTSFTASAKGAAAQLEWRTASERNNSHFEVERSVDSRSWTTIGRVAGNGDSDRELRYSFLDPAPQAGLNYYRLRQVDFDGQFDYSALVQLYLEQPHKLSASPNPSAAQLRLSWPAELPQGSLSIYALDGRRLYQWTLAAGQLEQNLEAAQLPPGVYLARLCDPAGSELDVIKLWKQ